MKKEGSLKTILAILVIILLCLVSFGGIYVKDKNIMKNVVPEYTLGMELDTNTILKIDVVKDEEEADGEDLDVGEENDNASETAEESDTGVATEAGENASVEEASEETNSEENTENKQDGQAENIYTLDNYKKSKDIIEKRLNQSGVKQYTIRLDEQTGSIILEFPEDVDFETIQNAYQVGKIEFKIEETGEIIGDNNSIKKVETSIDDRYASYIGSYVKINIEFTSDAVNKFREIKNNYVVPTDEEGQAKENTIQIYVDGNSMLGSSGMEETEFLDAVINTTLPLTLGDLSTDQEVLDETLKAANLRKIILEGETLPIEYTASYGESIHSDIIKWSIISVFAIIAAVMFVYLMIRFKLKGILAGLSIVGFGALLSLVLRYTKVQISIASIVSIAGVLVLQFIYLIRVLKNKDITSKVFNKETLGYSKTLIPAFITALVIAFANITEISGFGMVIFWGIVLFEIFNNIVTRAILTNGKNN